MELKESDFQSETGKRLYYLIIQGGKNVEKEFRDGLNQPPKKRYNGTNNSNAHSVASSPSNTTAHPIAASTPTAQPKTKKPQKTAEPKKTAPEQDLSDIVQTAQESQKRKWELPPEYRTLSIADALGYCINNRNIPAQDHTALLKIAANVVSGRSTLVTGVSNGGKSHTLSTILMSIPYDLQDEFADSKQFFKASTMHNGKFNIIHIDELQTFLRGSSNEKDAIRRIANGEHYDPKKEDGVDCPITAHGVYACVADSNAYKKRIMAADKELMRRFDTVEILLDEDKIKQRNATVVNGQTPSFNSNSTKNLNLQVLQYHFGQAIKKDIPDGSFFNPFAQFFAEYIQDVCKEKGNLEESTEVIKGNKAGMIFGIKWYGDQRKFEKAGQFKYISNIEDAFIAKLITDKDLGRETNNFDWQSCWESGLESLRSSGYPIEIIASYQAKHVTKNNKLYVTNPFTKEQVLLADLNQPRTGYLVVTQEQNNTFTEENTSTKATPSSIDDTVNKAPKPENTAHTPYSPALPVPINHSEPAIIDADFTVLNETKALPGEKTTLPVPVNGTYRPAPRSNGRTSSPGLPLKEHKYITCKED